MSGKVYLIGAGPGDPGLLTVKGKACIQAADVVIYDYLAAPALLGHARPDAEMIYVGKKGGDHTLSQEGINALLVEKAAAGHVVARLKGGDPFIFGRGGEEAEALIENHLAFEVVPGVTSAIAAPCYAGIPLTHRRFTSTVAFVTGHEDPTKKDSRIDWAALAKGIGTLVFLMGVKNLQRIVTQLLAHGRDPQTPVALVRWGTTANQQAVSGTLETIVEIVKRAELQAPAVIVVGDVVKMRTVMNWFEPQRPLLGKRIVITRARQQASDLVAKLSALGADCLECPTIEIVPPESWQAVDDAIQKLDAYQWLVFTSVNGVEQFFQRLFAADRDVRALGHLKLAAIGPATAEKMAAYGLRTDILPEQYRAESVVAAFRKQSMAGQRVLLPRAAEARAILPEELSEMGAQVDEVIAYRTRSVDDTEGKLIEWLENDQIDMVTFTSSSTVKNFHRLLPPERSASLMDAVSVACIGPITADTARSLGFKVALEAEKFTIDGLCDAVVAHYPS